MVTITYSIHILPYLAQFVNSKSKNILTNHLVFYSIILYIREI